MAIGVSGSRSSAMVGLERKRKHRNLERERERERERRMCGGEGFGGC